MSAARYLPCSVGPIRLAFDISGLSGIRRGDRIRLNPSPEGPPGWLQVEDAEIPVADLGIWLGREPRLGIGKTAAGRVLIFEGDSSPRALLIDASGRARDVQEGAIQPLPSLLGDLQPLGFRGSWSADDRCWLVVDPTAILADARRPPAPELDSHEHPSAPRIAPAPGHSPNGRGHRLLLFATPGSERLEPAYSFALSVHQVLEVAEPPPIDPVPGAPDFVVGLTLWRGESLAVVDLDRRMGRPPADDRGDRLLVVQARDGQRAGVIATSSSRLLRLPVAHRAVHHDFPDELVLGAYEIEAQTVVIPDLDALTSPASSR